MEKLTWDDLTHEEQKQCEADINQSGYDFDGSEEYATDEVAKDLWIRGFSYALEKVSKQISKTLRESTDEIDKLNR